MDVPPQLSALLENYDFPGNVRELRSMILDTVSRNAHSGALSLEPFRRLIRQTTPRGPMLSENPNGLLTFGEQLPTIREATSLLIDEALRRTDGNQTAASRFLGISQPALSKRLRTPGNA